MPKTAKHKPSSLTILDALALARKAGYDSPDTGLFGEWLVKVGLDERSPIVQSHMYRVYLEGFEQKMSRPVTILGAIVALAYEYKGYDLWEDDNKNWHYSGEPESAFDSLKDVRRFIDSL